MKRRGFLRLLGMTAVAAPLLRGRRMPTPVQKPAPRTPLTWTPSGNTTITDLRLARDLNVSGVRFIHSAMTPEEVANFNAYGTVKPHA